MIDRRILVTGLAVVVFAGGWFLHGLVPPAHAPARVGPDLEPPAAGSGSAVTSTTRAQTFATIYKTATWGTNDGSAGTSGFGSMVRTTIVYRAFLERFIKDNEIHSVVDAGCGDWEFSKVIDWTGIDYKGYDIVDSVIEQDKRTFAKPNIQFFKADIIEADLPPADLLIVKDVLQHLPNADVQRFLVKQLPKYKHVLLTNGTGTGTLSSPNPDIHIGEYRGLDLSRAPFGVPGLKVLTYWEGGNMHQVYYVRGTGLTKSQP